MSALTPMYVSNGEVYLILFYAVKILRCNRSDIAYQQGNISDRSAQSPHGHTNTQQPRGETSL